MSSLQTKLEVLLDKDSESRQLPLFGELGGAERQDAEQQFWDSISEMSRADIKASNDTVTRALFDS